MTLKEKFDSPIMRHDLGRNEIEETKEQCEEIADEFAIGFAEWFTNEESEYSIMYGNQEKRFATFTKDYTAKELLEIYKKEKGL
jgi:hypothetical protein